MFVTKTKEATTLTPTFIQTEIYTHTKCTFINANNCQCFWLESGVPEFIGIQAEEGVLMDLSCVQLLLIRAHCNKIFFQTSRTNVVAHLWLSGQLDPHKPVSKAGQQARAEKKKKINKSLNLSCSCEKEHGRGEWNRYVWPLCFSFLLVFSFISIWHSVPHRIL